MKKPNLRPYDKAELLLKADAEAYYAKNYFTKSPKSKGAEKKPHALESFADLHEDDAFLALVHPKYVI